MLNLTKFAQRLLETFRDSDVIGRLGRDEFVAMQTNFDNEHADEVLIRFAAADEDANATMNKQYSCHRKIRLPINKHCPVLHTK
jgi:GGDEF domain-containing protein